MNSTLFSSICSVEPEIPLQIEPQKTVIEPNSSSTFKITFSPMVAATYNFKLISNIQSLHPSSDEMNIVITAKSTVRNFYFEAEETDYLSKRPALRKSFSDDLPDPIVLECVAIGIGIVSET